MKRSKAKLAAVACGMARPYLEKIQLKIEQQLGVRLDLDVRIRVLDAPTVPLPETQRAPFFTARHGLPE